jgi:hypothetical protein
MKTRRLEATGQLDSATRSLLRNSSEPITRGLKEKLRDHTYSATCTQPPTSTLSLPPFMASDTRPSAIAAAVSLLSPAFCSRDCSQLLRSSLGVAVQVDTFEKSKGLRKTRISRSRFKGW